MARGRHVRRSGLLSRLLLVGGGRRYGGSRRVRWSQQERAVIGLRTDVSRLEAELSRLRVLGAQHAAAAAAADLRTRQAEEALGAATVEVSGLRADFAALREELVWAFAERKLAVDAPDASPVPATVIDLTAARTGSATG